MAARPVRPVRVALDILESGPDSHSSKGEVDGRKSYVEALFSGRAFHQSTKHDRIVLKPHNSAARKALSKVRQAKYNCGLLNQGDILLLAAPQIRQLGR